MEGQVYDNLKNTDRVQEECVAAIGKAKYEFKFQEHLKNMANNYTDVEVQKVCWWYDQSDCGICMENTRYYRD